MTFQLRLRSIGKGLATRIPLVDRLANSAAGAPVGARYFYSVWLRHLVRAQAAYPALKFDVVGELGPGDGLGLGLCALLSGARRYIGLDRLAFALRADNVAMLAELCALFAARASIPGEDEFPGVYPRLADYAFPHRLLDDARLRGALEPARVARIEAELRGAMDPSAEAMIGYAAPWDEGANVRDHVVDFLVSQAVLEHVDDVEAAYHTMRRWLKPDGVMSHRIDYTCHGITRDWYGHWLVSEPMWRLARGRRAYFINRLPHSAHASALGRCRFHIVIADTTRGTDSAPAAQMRVPHDAADLGIRGAYIVARPAAA